TAEHLVLATGNYARQSGRLLGLNVPAIPVEHQYIVYDESAQLKAYRQGGGRELAVLRESDRSYYLREERLGWILGPYERGAPAGSSPSGSSRGNRRSTCWRWIRAASVRIPASATSSRRTRKPTAMCSSSTSRTRSAPTPGRRRPVRCTR